jgi:hypothetical protein
VVSKDSSGKEKGSAEQGMGKGKEIDDSSPSQAAKKKGRRLHFADEVEETPRVSSPITRSVPRDFRYLPCIHSLLNIQLKEWMKIRCSPEEKDQVIKSYKIILKKLNMS